MTTNHAALIARLRFGYYDEAPTDTTRAAADALEAMQPSVREPLKAEQLWDHSELMELNGEEMGLSMDAMMRFTRMIEAMHGISVKGEA